MNNISLRDRILNAESKEQVKELLDEGMSYKFATPTTRRRWGRAAVVRLAELQKGNGN